MSVLDDGKGCGSQSGTAEHWCADCCYLGMFMGFHNVAHIVLACAAVVAGTTCKYCMRQQLCVLASVRQRSLQMCSHTGDGLRCSH